jgi:DNA-binding CsgD family transcriptional regulator
MRYRQRLKTNIILKNLNAEKYKRELNKKEFLEKEIAYKKKDLSDFAINIAHNQDWANQLHQRLLKIQSLSGRAKGKQMDLLAKDVKSKLQIEGITSAVHDKIELLSNKFYSRLKVDFLDLSKTEIRLCTLIRLNLDNNEIAILQNLTIESVYKSRYRLRKKLNLPSNTNLSVFLKDF